MLANLYLHWFDALFHGPQGPVRKADVKPVRYADDFVALAKQLGVETIEFIESKLEGKFQLEINREKTRVVDLREQGASLDFLGQLLFFWVSYRVCTGKSTGSYAAV